MLAAVFAALAAWCLLVELPADRHPPPPPPAVLTAPDTVTRLELNTPAGTITATRGPDGWVDAAGAPWPYAPIDDLLRTLADLRPLRTIAADAEEAARYHVGARRLRLVRHDGSVALDLELGDLNPAETALYARTTAQPGVMLLGSVLQWELRRIVPADSVVPSR